MNLEGYGGGEDLGGHQGDETVIIYYIKILLF